MKSYALAKTFFVSMFVWILFCNCFIVSSEEGSALSSSSGSVLCQALIKIYDGVSLRSQEQALPDKSLISDALKSLLVVSTTAKAVALEGNALRLSGLLQLLRTGSRRSQKHLGFDEQRCFCFRWLLRNAV